jgi:hypothetical protein
MQEKKDMEAEAASFGDDRIEHLETATPTPDQPWTDEAEQKLVRKVDFIVMPVLWLCYVMLQLDRGNM